MRCPVCRADNTQGPQCRRCRADLSLLFTLEEERARVLAMASASAASGQWHDAVVAAKRADELRSDDESRRLRALSHLMTRDFARAWRCYANWQSSLRLL